ncbi:glycosyltransferase involved in cell wall biosynthesis [Paenibacillus taihuensis]|uniref:Glycosyltransferase involved in cell wall biosynthesis n=1 Tax=Paenibacillus taihuensis TaxID=1156355 RepID=A0A3D9Q3V6_9BACL|nr:glycosyltransferase family 4 protein [Paenibacillus taihuensis]REE57521.1 glycosyltransferase involved in cell wall biosynthesis [Paenibacillus taihuensis]
MNTKKAAYIATVYSHLSVFHVPFMNMLKSQGYEVHAYASPDHCKKDVKQAFIACHDIPFSRNPLSWNNVKALGQLVKRFKEEQYDLIHVHTPNASVVCRIAAKLAGCQTSVVYTAHGFHFFKGAPLLNWLLYYPVERLLSRWTDVLITINQEDYERARKFPVRGKAVYIPGVGVDVSSYRNTDIRKLQTLREELGLTGEEFVVLSVAELNRNKNLEQLIHAIHEMTQLGAPIVGLLAGVGNREPQLRALVKQLNLEQNIMFLGFRRDIPDLIHVADTCVLMSEREGLPKVLLEAMSAGKPMVVTDIRGNRELVDQDSNGYKVPVGDTVATAGALFKLFLNPKLRAEMGRRSWEKAATFDMRNIMNELKYVYAERIPFPEQPEAEPIQSTV